jgi:hypothetical protein
VVFLWPCFREHHESHLRKPGTCATLSHHSLLTTLSSETDFNEPSTDVDYKRPLLDDSGLESEQGPTPKRAKMDPDDAPHQSNESKAPKKSDADTKLEPGGKFNEPPFTFLPSDFPQIQSVR